LKKPKRLPFHFLEGYSEMMIKDCMKSAVISVSDRATLKEAVALILQYHIGTLPVVDATHRLVGVLKMKDILTLVMPDFVQVLESFEFVHDFGAGEMRQPSIVDLKRPVRDLMEAPVSVEQTAGLLRAVAMLYHHELLDLPVTDLFGKLVGIASQVDVGTALMKQWHVDDLDSTTLASGEGP
jgi:CBS-domain-containing membrane protein